MIGGLLYSLIKKSGEGETHSGRIFENGARTEVLGDWIKDHDSGYALSVKRNHLWRAYDEWVKSTRTHGSVHESDRKSILKKLCPSIKERQLCAFDRAVCFVLPPLDQCRREFAEALKSPIKDLFPNEIEVIHSEDIEESISNRVDSVRMRIQESDCD